LKAGVTLLDFISNAKPHQITRRRFHKPKIKNRLTEASFAKLTLEGEGDAFRFHFERKTLPNRTKAIPQTENKKLSAHQS
jgi:hypothetical protein